MCRLAGNVTLQTGRAGRKYLPRYGPVLLSQRLQLLLYIWVLLARKRHKETHQGLQLVRREIECGHARLQIWPHTIAVQSRLLDELAFALIGTRSRSCHRARWRW